MTGWSAIFLTLTLSSAVAVPRPCTPSDVVLMAASGSALARQGGVSRDTPVPGSPSYGSGVRRRPQAPVNLSSRIPINQRAILVNGPDRLFIKARAGGVSPSDEMIAVTEAFLVNAKSRAPDVDLVVFLIEVPQMPQTMPVNRTLPAMSAADPDNPYRTGLGLGGASDSLPSGFELSLPASVALPESPITHLTVLARRQADGTLAPLDTPTRLRIEGIRADEVVGEGGENIVVANRFDRHAVVRMNRQLWRDALTNEKLFGLAADYYRDFIGRAVLEQLLATLALNGDPLVYVDLPLPEQSPLDRFRAWRGQTSFIRWNLDDVVSAEDLSLARSFNAPAHSLEHEAAEAYWMTQVMRREGRNRWPTPPQNFQEQRRRAVILQAAALARVGGTYSLDEVLLKIRALEAAYRLIHPVWMDLFGQLGFGPKGIQRFEARVRRLLLSMNPMRTDLPQQNTLPPVPIGPDSNGGANLVWDSSLALFRVVDL